MKIFFPLFKSYRKKNFPISLCKQLLMLVNHKNLKIKCLCSSSNCLPWKIKLTLVSIKSMQLNTENFYTQKENMNANFFNFKLFNVLILLRRSVWYIAITIFGVKHVNKKWTYFKRLRNLEFFIDFWCEMSMCCPWVIPNNNPSLIEQAGYRTQLTGC